MKNSVLICPECGVEINCKAERCPLCQAVLEKNASTDRAFPVGKIKKRRPDLFSKIYVAVALIVVIACIIVNVIYNYKFMWSMMVMVVAVYVFYCVRFTFLAQGRFGALIFGQAVAHTAVFVAIRLIIGGNHFIFITWLPVVYFVSEILLGIYVLMRPQEMKKRMMTIFVMGILGIVPVLCAYLFDLSVKWPCIATTAFSVVLVIVTAILGRKHIYDQLKRYFHR